MDTSNAKNTVAIEHDDLVAFGAQVQVFSKKEARRRKRDSYYFLMVSCHVETLTARVEEVFRLLVKRRTLTSIHVDRALSNLEAMPSPERILFCKAILLFATHLEEDFADYYLPHNLGDIQQLVALGELDPRVAEVRTDPHVFDCFRRRCLPGLVTRVLGFTSVPYTQMEHITAFVADAGLAYATVCPPYA